MSHSAKSADVCGQAAEKWVSQMRAPAVPLVAHDPYFSAWSMTDELNASWPRHWTGASNGMCIMARVDGKAYRLCGDYQPAEPMKQISAYVYPTRTVYRFAAASVEVTLTFLTPAIADDLDLMSRPVTYVEMSASSVDEKKHDVQFYLDAGGEWAVNEPAQSVNWSRHRIEGLSLLSMCASEQSVLERSGDNLRIEWGYFYLAIPQQPGMQDALAPVDQSRDCFIAGKPLPIEDDMNMPCVVRISWPGMAAAIDLGKVDRAGASRHIMLAYDDCFSIEYMYRKLRPYWRRNGMTIGQVLREAQEQYADIKQRCKAYDEKLLADLHAAGGKEYATLCSLAYRQCLAAHKLAADIDGTPLYFSKENFSNGCIATVDLTYPSSPLFLLLSPELLKAQITPVLDYAASPRWKFNFAPHDLGTYPLANGQVYGGGEFNEHNQMPVEECGNMLIMLAALVKKTHDTAYAKKYLPILKIWADYLYEKGLRPENQLCTDDFAGHIAGNTNLAIKAVIGVAGYGLLAGETGDAAECEKYLKIARQMAGEWEKLTAGGEATPLVFDRADTWAQKYNLVWDKMLGLNLFSPEIARREVAYYLKKQNVYGLPLDSRQSYTKLDWEVWSATLAEKQDDFVALIRPLLKWVNETPSRVPLTDWYDTVSGKQCSFQARSVVGGMFIKLLAQKGVVS